MDNNQILMKEKLEFFGILKQALTVPYRNPKFIILTFLASIPLFFSILLHETILQHALIQIAKDLLKPNFICNNDFCYSVDTPYDKYIEAMYSKLPPVGLLYLGIVHLLDLYNTIVIINSASAIYAGEISMNLKDMICSPIKKARFRGPFITSIYALLLTSITLVGVYSLATNVYITWGSMLFGVIFGVPVIALLIKYMEWGAIWNMGMVLSILEDKHGDVALGVSAYISRGSRGRGLLLMLVFFVWRFVLRLLCFYVGWNEGGTRMLVTGMQVCFVCVGNVMKWVAFMVYFYDCKKRFLEKKVDVEDGRAAEGVK